MARLLHEVRGPLAAARNAVRWLQLRRSNADSRDVERMLSGVQADLEVVVRLMDDLDVGGDSQERSDRVASVSELLASVIAGIRTMVNGQAPDVSVNVELNGTDTIPSLSSGSSALRRVFYNLLSNSAKYRNADSEELRVTISAVRQGQELLFDVLDWGLGIPPGWEELIFEEGVRAPNARDVPARGAGIGLFVVREALRELGGNAVLVSRRDPTVVRLILPDQLVEGEDTTQMR